MQKRIRRRDQFAHCCPVCLGMPGVLPVPNAEAIVKTLLTGEMLGCQIATRCKFDRKNYFYPDMPKNYQISQYDDAALRRRRSHARPARLPEGRAEGPGRPSPTSGIRLVRIHLEEDVAKSFHFEDAYQRHRLQPRRHAADGNRERSRHVDAGRSLRLSLRAQANPRLRQRQRRRHGEGTDALRREHFHPSEAASRNSAPSAN